MRLTPNEVHILKTLLTADGATGSLIRRWNLKSDRHLAVDETLDLCKKLKLNVPKKVVQQLGKIADDGKENE